MEFTFTHTLLRDSGDPDFYDEVPLTVKATVYMGEVDDIKWVPSIELEPEELKGLKKAADEELKRVTKAAREEDAYYDSLDEEAA